MVVNKSCVAACLESVRMAVESVSGCSWNECPDVRGITVRMCVEWVSESAWNPQILRKCLWWVPDFSVHKYRAELLALDSQMRQGEPFVAHSTRHLIEARR